MAHKLQSSSDNGLKALIATRTGRSSGTVGAVGKTAKGKKSKTADAAYLDLCRYLEEENTRLQRSIDIAQSELESSKAEAKSAALIPQYRLAIVR